MTKQYDELEVAKELARIRTNMILDQPFFGTLACRLKLKIDPTCDTAWTDGTHLAVNPAWFMPLKTGQKMGLVCHEVMHVANGHVWRRGARDHRKFNLACDFAIDPIIKESGLELPDIGDGTEGHINPAWSGKSAEEIYQLLPPPDPNKKGGGKGPGDISDLDVRDAPRETASADQGEWQVAVLQAAMAARQMGKLPGSLQRLVDEIKQPKVSWKDILRRFIQETARADYNWESPDPDYAHVRLYMPVQRSEQMPPVVVAIDTSGSISAEELQAFASEVGAVKCEARPEKLHVVYWDSKIQGIDEFEAEDVFVPNPRGGGGSTALPQVTGWIEDEDIQPACLIVLTDMCITFPEETDYPTLFVSNTDVVGPFGETIRIEV
jgi:predicted metal-dependent peptidase